MSTTKGRKIIKNSAGLGIYQDTIRAGSAEQGMLVKQDEVIGALNAMVDIVSLSSAAGAGGAATEAMTVTGLKTTDTIIAVSQMTKGASNLPLLGWSTVIADGLTGIWSANPGAGAVLVVSVARARTAVAKVDLK